MKAIKLIKPEPLLFEFDQRTKTSDLHRDGSIIGDWAIYSAAKELIVSGAGNVPDNLTIEAGSLLALRIRGCGKKLEGGWPPRCGERADGESWALCTECGGPYPLAKQP